MRHRAAGVHVELDEVRHLIVSGLADPQAPGPLQAEQYDTSVAACCALVREFVGNGYDVAVDDAVDPEGYERHWLPRLGGIECSVVVVRPSLETVLERDASRSKRVRPDLVREQHAAASRWPTRRHHRPYWPVRRGEPAGRTSPYRRWTLASGGGVHTQAGRPSPSDADGDSGPARGTDSKVNHANFALRGFSQVGLSESA